MALGLARPTFIAPAGTAMGFVSPGESVTCRRCSAKTTPLILDDAVLIALGLLLVAAVSSLVYLVKFSRWQWVLPAALPLLYVSAAIFAWIGKTPAVSGLLGLCAVAPLLVPMLRQVRIWLGLLLVGTVILTIGLQTRLPILVMHFLDIKWTQYQALNEYLWRPLKFFTVLLMALTPLVVLLLKAEASRGPMRDVAAVLVGRNRMAQRGFTLIEVLASCAVVLSVGVAGVLLRLGAGVVP
jgi:prepilin-type N-terminal cleavage/methylation domain-containing protein